MNLTDILKKLSLADGVSGLEESAGTTALEMLKEYCLDAEIDSAGNIIGSIESSSDKKRVLLDAHIDQVGFIVTAITEEGFIRVGNVGGLDMRIMPAQNVSVHGRRTIPGVIASVPPHLSGGEEKVMAVTDVLIDTGYSKEELSTIVSPGDRITFDTPFMELQGDCIAARSMDDRCGVAAILYALELLKGKELPCNLSVLFSVQEETGENGAEMAGYSINPDVAIAVDVSFACAHGDDPVKCGKMGKGAMIGISPTLSGELSQTLISKAQEENLPWQYEIMNGTTGTNADRFSVCRGGAKTCTVSIPLRYMHTPSEIISLSDIENTGRLIAAWIMGGAVC